MTCYLSVRFYILVIYCGMCASNQYDPRPFPKAGPFFEGWYMRITDFNRRETIGLLMGNVLPAGESDLIYPKVIASLLYRERRNDCYLEEFCNCYLRRWDAVFNIDMLNITVKGEAVRNRPDNESPANFQWMAVSDSSKVILKQSTTTYFEFKQDEITFTGRIGKGAPWGKNGEGPEGWSINLPIPLHWFVFSLYAPVEYYELKIGNEIVVSGTNARAHLENNWGDSFPKAWVWAQGADDHGVVFAIAGGLAPIIPGLLTVKAYLAGYRNPSKNIILNFRPYNSVVSTSFDGCTGSANFTISGLFHVIEISIHSNIDTYSECLLAPTSIGFRPFCEETYDAVAEIVVWKRTILPPFSNIVDKETIQMTALEFGGDYVCDKKCG